MSLLTAISLSVALLSAAHAAEIVVLQTGTSMRIPNNKIEIRVQDSGQVTVKTQNLRAEWVSVEKTIDSAGIAELKKKLSSIDWGLVSKDHDQGLDGTSVNLEFGSVKARLWSPEYDSKKRGLLELQKAIESLYQLACLTKNGMPLTPEIFPPDSPAIDRRR